MDVEHSPHTTPCPPAISLSRKEHAGEKISPPPSSPNYHPLKGVKHLEHAAASSGPTVGAKLGFDKRASLPVTRLNNISLHPHPPKLIEKSLSECIFIRITYHHPDDCAAVCSHIGRNAPTEAEKNWNLENKENKDFDHGDNFEKQKFEIRVNALGF